MFKRMKAHPFLAEIFPWPPTKGQVEEMAKSIGSAGQFEPIVLFGEEIVDGRLREDGAIEARVKPKYRQWGSRPEDGDDLRPAQSRRCREEQKGVDFEECREGHPAG